MISNIPGHFYEPFSVFPFHFLTILKLSQTLIKNNLTSEETERDYGKNERSKSSDQLQRKKKKSKFGANQEMEISRK